MSLIPYTKRQLVQRIRKHVADGFADDAFTASTNEILLYVDSALAFNLVGSVWMQAKIEGNIAVPEGYLTTYLLPSVQQDNVSKEWYSMLPQPPVGLPLGYSIDRCYFANSINGVGNEVLLIKAKRVAYRKNMPSTLGVRAWVEGSKIILVASNGTSLLNQPLYVRMASTRTDDLDAIMNLPDDAIQKIFDQVVLELTKRYQEPKDIIRDELPAGNNNLKG